MRRRRGRDRLGRSALSGIAVALAVVVLVGSFL